jgi:hypothetical protein
MQYPDAPASKGFTALAERLVENTEGSAFEGDIRFFWQRLLNYS